MEFYSIRNFSKSRVQDDSWIGEMKKKKFYLRFNERMVNQFFFFYWRIEIWLQSRRWIIESRIWKRERKREESRGKFDN